MDEAEFLADRIIVLAGGEIVAEGTPQTLGGRDRSGARITFTLPPQLSAAELPVGLQSLARADSRVEIRTAAPMQDLRRLADWAAEQQVDLPDIEVRRPTLEDIYLELTGAAVS
jgi:ABC-2 type transport system ATP-binding protein